MDQRFGWRERERVCVCSLLTQPHKSITAEDQASNLGEHQTEHGTNLHNNIHLGSVGETGCKL